MIGIVLSFLTGGFSKLTSAVLGLLKSIPWYVLTIVCLVLILLLAWRHENATIATADKKVAAADARISAWQKVNAINARSVDVLLAAVKANNATIALFRADAERFDAAARAIDAKSAASAATAESLRAALKSNPPTNGGVQGPASYQQIRSQL
jgi:hypothetical protein